MCDVMLVTWTLKTTWKYKCPYNNYASQRVFDTTSRNGRYKTSKKLYCNKITKVSLMNTYILKIISYIKKLDQLDFIINYKLNIDLCPMQFIVKRKKKIVRCRNFFFKKLCPAPLPVPGDQRITRFTKIRPIRFYH
jgi:hypothetical protein